MRKTFTLLALVALGGCGDGGLLVPSNVVDTDGACGPSVPICRDGSCAGTCALTLPLQARDGVRVYVDGSYEGWPFYLDAEVSGDAAVLTGDYCATWLRGATWPLVAIYGPDGCEPVHQ
jgi:hypothetical protein